MPRVARVVIPGCLYHVTQRGNYQQNVFRDDKDRIIYLRYLNQNCQKWGLRLYAFCLMDNHVHLIVKPESERSMAKSLSIAHMKYAHYFNAKTKQKGHLWQGRFYSCLIGDQLHLERAVRYVERNPVRAQIVQFAWDYSWSSAMFHLGKNYSIIKIEDIKEYFDTSCWRDYLLEEEMEEDLRTIRLATRRCLSWGPAHLGQTLLK